MEKGLQNLVYWDMQQKSKHVIYEITSRREESTWQGCDNWHKGGCSTDSVPSLSPGLWLSQSLSWPLLQLKQSSELQTQIWSCLHEIKWWNPNVNKFKMGLLALISPKNSYSLTPSAISYCRKHFSFHSFAHPNLQ